MNIGEFSNVPEPGAGIQSAWAQQVTARVIHRFADTTILNGWNAADGSVAFVAPTLYRRVGGAWVALVDVNAMNQAISNAIAPLNAQINNMQLQLNQHTNQIGVLNTQVRYGSTGQLPNVTTDGNGDARITFPYPYTSVPSVSATVAGANAGIANVQLVVHSQDTVGFTVRCFYGPGGNNWAPWSGAASIGWVASGAQLA